MKKLNFTLTTFLSLSTLIISFLSPAMTNAAYDQVSAQTYLSNHQGSPWVTMALSALGANAISTDYLKFVSSNSAIDYEAPMLALTSLNKNPHTFGSTDYVAKLESFDNNGQIGDPTTLNDDIFGLLALVSAGEPTSTKAIADAKDFILAHQNSNGGWGFSVNSGSDSNTTVSAIVALVADGIAAADSRIQNAVAYLKTTQNNDGGFTYDPTSKFGTDSDSSSTAWAIWALHSLKIDPHTWTKTGGDPLSYLAANQAAPGYFKFQNNSNEDNFSPITTSYAAIALTGKSLPIATSNGQVSSSAAQYSFRIEGSAQNVCTGQTHGPTALDIVKNASTLCGFTYEIKQTSFGPYLNKINIDAASGNTGWLYLVNNISPPVGAADYQLKAGDAILWYFGDFTWLPSKLSINSGSITPGNSAVVTVQDFTDGNWVPLSGATVYFGTSSALTNNNGTVTIFPPDGLSKIFASKPGFIRSNSTFLQVGQASSATVGLSANLQLGEVKGTSTPDTIAFTVTPSQVDFGTLTAGQSSTKNISINNTGSTNISVQSIVSGDDVFKNSLNINNTLWSTFQSFVTAGQNKTIPLTLAIPSGITGTSGQINGQIIFWATAQ